MSRDNRLLELDTAARIDALDVSRSFIVQAPAGSGKTELLIQRYLNVLAVVENPEEVVAITFTRKAAAEMQLRVLKALQRAECGNTPGEAHDRQTFELAVSVLMRSESLGWNLTANPRRLRIQTMDSLNASIVRRQPLFASGSGSRLVLGADLRATYQQAAVATLDWLTESGSHSAAVVNVLKHVDNNTSVYTAYLAQMLATRDQWLPFIGSGQLSDADARAIRARFEQALEISVSEHLQRSRAGLESPAYADLTGLLDYAAKNVAASDSDENPISGLSGLTALPAATPAHLSEWQGLAELLFTRTGTVRKRINKGQGFPPQGKAEKATMQSLLELISNDAELAANLQEIGNLPPVEYRDDQWTVLLALFRLLPLAVTELKRLFSERGITDYTDVALLANAALGSADQPGDMALLLDYQIKHLLVDEMQDTSAAQYRMLEALVGGWQEGDGRSLCCVGDPMQSVYRFRNAEVGQFLLAQEFGIGQIQLHTLSLRRNFRSGEVLVDWFNAVFPDVLAVSDDPARGAVAYAHALAVPQLHGQGRCVIHPIYGAGNEAEASAGCGLIISTLKENPHDNMAVLVRGRTQLPQLLSELRAAGVSYRAVEIDRLTDLPEIIEVLAITRAAAHPGDRIAWLGLLRCPWIGLDWSDLHALVRNDTSSSVWELLQDRARLGSLSECGRTAIGRSVEALRTLVEPQRSRSLRERIERVWFALGGPGLLDDRYAIENIYRYFDALEKLERAGTVVDVAELESVLDDERVSSNDNARLQIMTMHRSKGLQFDHVLLYGLGRQPGNRDRRVLSWFDLPVRSGTEMKVIAPVGPRAETDNDPIHRYIEATESKKDRFEQGRLLYVACTRARKTLHLMGNTALSNDGTEIKPARSGSLLRLLWPALKPTFERDFVARDAVAEADKTAAWVLPVLRRFATPWRYPPVSLLPGTVADGTEPESLPEVEFYWVGTDARIAGTMVHRWLQCITEDRGTNPLEDIDAFRQITSRWLRENGVSNESSEPVLQRIEAAVFETLRDPKGRWAVEGDGHSELALTGLYEGELVSVILDRVRIDADGVHWIIDYKTSSHEGGDLPAFLRAESDRYTSQLARYAALYAEWAGAEPKCALYFPLLKSFVEVKI